MFIYVALKYEIVAGKIYIAGKGVVSALGIGTEANKSALLDGKTGIGEIRFLQSGYAGKLPVAEVKYTNETLAQMVGLEPHITRTALLSILAAKEALDKADIPNRKALRSAFISANTVGGMDKTEYFFHDFLKNNLRGKLHDVINHDSGAATEIVAEKLEISDFVTTVSTACSSAANAIMYAARLIKQGQIDFAVAGGADALSAFTLNGFNSLMILDNEPCRPFDDTRKGLNLGEGAGYLVLVSEEIAQKLAQKPNIILSGYANANDAYHQTASSADGRGNFGAMQGALQMAKLEPKEIDYINLHGTGTSNNDSSEGIAIARLFGDYIPAVSSTKTYTGHTLGACAGVEAVYSCIAIENGIIFPNLRYQNKMQELNFEPVKELRTGQKIQHVLSNSFGFGGNCSALVFSSEIL